MSSIYTKRGDSGTTSLYSGERVPKQDLRVEAYGAVDELQACLGLARSFVVQDDIASVLFTAETTLVHAMAELATVNSEQHITSETVEELERLIDQYYENSMTFTWRVPGDNTASAVLHVARTVARRAEREILRFAETADVNAPLLAYFNRLSDLCYALACFIDEKSEYHD